MNFRTPLRLAALACALWVVGCGKSNDEIPKGEMVSGKVTIKGQPPHTFATIEFASEAGEKMSGSVDPSGVFHGRAPQGKVKVSLKMGSAPGAQQYAGSPYGAGKGGQPKGPTGGGSPAKDAGPAKMKGAVELSKDAQDPNKSGVELDVPMGGVQNVELDFKK